MGGIENFPDEEWKYVPWHKYSHMVSNYGRVYSVKSGTILKERLFNGSLGVQLIYNGNYKVFDLNKLVYNMFVEHTDKPVFNIDGNPHNHYYKNLSTHRKYISNVTPEQKEFLRNKCVEYSTSIINSFISKDDPDYDDVCQTVYLWYLEFLETCRHVDNFRWRVHGYIRYRLDNWLSKDNFVDIDSVNVSYNMDRIFENIEIKNDILPELIEKAGLTKPQIQSIPAIAELYGVRSDKLCCDIARSDFGISGSGLRERMNRSLRKFRSHLEVARPVGYNMKSNKYPTKRLVKWVPWRRYKEVFYVIYSDEVYGIHIDISQPATIDDIYKDIITTV